MGKKFKNFLWDFENVENENIENTKPNCGSSYFWLKNYIMCKFKNQEAVFKHRRIKWVICPQILALKLSFMH